MQGKEWTVRPTEGLTPVAHKGQSEEELTTVRMESGVRYVNGSGEQGT